MAPHTSWTAWKGVSFPQGCISTRANERSGIHLWAPTGLAVPMYQSQKLSDKFYPGFIDVDFLSG